VGEGKDVFIRRQEQQEKQICITSLWRCF